MPDAWQARTMVGLCNLDNSFADAVGAVLCGGQRYGQVVHARVVNGGFTSSRGFALGLVLVGTDVAALVLPPAMFSIGAAAGLAIVGHLSSISTAAIALRFG
jgi:hypothetical protein